MRVTDGPPVETAYVQRGARFVHSSFADAIATGRPRAAPLDDDDDDPAHPKQQPPSELDHLAAGKQRATTATASCF